MNDALGFALLAIVILCAILSPLAIYRSLKRDRMLPGILGGLLGAVGILCSLPFAETYETPWLPEVTIAYFAAVAFVSLSLLPAGPVPESGVAGAIPRRRRFPFAVRCVFAVAFLICCTFLWNKYDVRRAERDEAWAALQFLTSMGTNLNYGGDGFNVLSFSHPEIITDEDVKVLFVPALAKSHFRFHAVDLKGTQVTDAGVQSIVAALPECEVRL